MQQQPWYKQVWVWLIMVPPLAAVLGGITTIVIAASGADHVIRDDYVKVGLELREDASRLEAARRLGLSANVHLLRDDGRVIVTLRGQPAADAGLLLRLVHPTDANRDQEVTLTLDGNVYRGLLPQPVAGRWLLQLEPVDHSWRLAGELAAEASAVALGVES